MPLAPILAQKLHALYRQQTLLVERAEYAYLPAEKGMVLGGYTELNAGNYQHIQADGVVRGVTILSQTGLMLMFRNERFLGARVVDSDEGFMRFLCEHHFPLPG